MFLEQVPVRYLIWYDNLRDSGTIPVSSEFVGFINESCHGKLREYRHGINYSVATGLGTRSTQALATVMTVFS